MMLGTILQVSNHVLGCIVGTLAALIVKLFLKSKPPGLQTFLDTCMVEASNAYVIYNLSCNLAQGIWIIQGLSTCFVRN